MEGPDLLERKGLSTVASVLEEYGLLCEADMMRLDETDLGSLSSKLRPLQGNLLRKWVQGLATGCTVTVGQFCLAPHQLPKHPLVH